jgi:hypothetical protein
LTFRGITSARLNTCETLERAHLGQHHCPKF